MFKSSVSIRWILLIGLLSQPLVWLRAQEPLPPDPQSSSAADDPNGAERIVDGRPPLYTIKRNAHPLTWLELMFKPAFRSAENGFLHGLMTRKPDTDKESGVRFGLAGDGTGSGFGPEVTFFNKNLLHRGIEIEVPLVYTYSRYQRYEFKARVPLAKDTFVDRLSFDFGAGYHSRARDDFFGIGNESFRDDERQLRTVTREASTGFSAKVDDAWTAGAHAVYRNVGVTRPTVGWSAQDHFTEAGVPGLFGATIGSAVFTLGRDNKKFDDRSFQGGSEQFELSFHRTIGGDTFQYWRSSFDSQHFFRLTSDGRKVIAARGMVETNVPMNGGLVPFFDMPALGSSGTVRGYENFRFRDRSAAAFSLEYRYRIWPALDWGLFLDEGQVAPRLGDLAFDRFHTSYGLRLFVWPNAKSAPFSIDWARSKESWRIYFNVGARF